MSAAPSGTPVCCARSGFGDLPHLVERLDPDHALGAGCPDRRRDAGAAAEIDDQARARSAGLGR
jgi:hypothetical protein